MIWNGKRMKKSIGFMALGFGSVAIVTRLHIVKDEVSHLGPVVLPLNKVKSLGLSRVSRGRVVMFGSEDA